jgi:23S rRNA (pseudouridine1915-N3)-methyltransferase
MKIFLIAIGNRMPSWVIEAYSEYSKRMPNEFKLELIELTAIRRTKNIDTKSIIQKEGTALLAAIPKNCAVVLLDGKGAQWSTEDLAQNMNKWSNNGQNIALLVGGPDGHDESCKQHASQSWSLSRLTFPHPFVRVIIAEQLYRASCILKNHPYHK